MGERPERTGQIALVGLRGSGKSVVARAVADDLGWDVIDTDLEVERRLGPIADLFARGREAEFRAEEQRQLLAALSCRSTVVATGGGAVMAANSRAVLRDVFCVWLWADPEILVARTQGSERPALTTLGALDEVRTVLDQRWRAYADVADMAIDSGRYEVEAVARIVAAAWAASR